MKYNLSTIGARTANKQTTIEDLHNDVLYCIIERLDNPSKVCLALSSRRFYQTMMATSAPAPLTRISDLCSHSPVHFTELYCDFNDSEYASLMQRMVLSLSREQIMTGLSYRQHGLDMTILRNFGYDWCQEDWDRQRFMRSFDRWYHRTLRDARERAGIVKTVSLPDFLRFLTGLHWLFFNLIQFLFHLFINSSLCRVPMDQYGVPLPEARAMIYLVSKSLEIASSQRRGLESWASLFGDDYDPLRTDEAERSVLGSHALGLKDAGTRGDTFRLPAAISTHFHHPKLHPNPAFRKHLHDRSVRITVSDLHKFNTIEEWHEFCNPISFVHPPTTRKKMVRKTIVSTIDARTAAQTTIKDLNNDILDSIISSVDNVDKACLALSSRRFYDLVLATAAPAPLAKVTDLCPRPPWKRLSLSDYESDYSELMRRLVLYLTRKQMRAGLLSRQHFPCTCAWEEINGRQILVCSHCTSHKMSPYEFKYDFDRNYYDLVRGTKKTKWTGFGKRVVEELKIFPIILVAAFLLTIFRLALFFLVGCVGEILGFF